MRMIFSEIPESALELYAQEMDWEPCRGEHGFAIICDTQQGEVSMHVGLQSGKTVVFLSRHFAVVNSNATMAAFAHIRKTRKQRIALLKRMGASDSPGLLRDIALSNIKGVEIKPITVDPDKHVSLGESQREEAALCSAFRLPPPLVDPLHAEYLRRKGNK